MGTKKKTVYPVTKKPSGVTISRNGMTFIVAWKIGDANYGAGQTFEFYNPVIKKWQNKKITAAQTTVSIPLNPKSFYPYMNRYLKEFKVRIKGRRKQYKETRKEKNKKGKTEKWEYTFIPKESPWAEATFRIDLPPKPSLTASWNSSKENQTTYSWSTGAATNAHYITTDTQFQTVWIANSNTAPSKLGDKRWGKFYTRTPSSSYAPIEETSGWQPSKTWGGYSFTRYVRVRSRGPKGVSPWVYTRHTYAQPMVPVIKNTRSVSARRGLLVYVQWQADQSFSHPIDEVQVQYKIEAPVKNGLIPSVSGFTTAHTLYDTSYRDGMTIEIPHTLAGDEMLYLKIAVKHDNQIRESAPIRAAGAGSFLTPPSGLAIVSSGVDPTTWSTQIKASNNSSVPDSKLAVILRLTDKKNKTEDRVVQIIGHGVTDYVNVQCPDLSSYKDYVFGVYAFQGSYKVATKKVVGGRTAYTYTVSANVRSSAVFTSSGRIPKAPTGVTVTKVNEESVKVTWKRSWVDGDYSEISWSDHNDAWESTDQPQTYRVPNTHVAAWNIHGLEVGKKWYIRVRQVADGESGEIEGPWSTLNSASTIDLSSDPDKPYLTASTYVTTLKTNIKLSWVYTSTDTTAQSSAKICLATVANGKVTYGSVIATASTQQSVVINPATLKWAKGNSYQLCVKVTSDSNRSSEWSDPIKITIADPVTANITQTSIVTLKYIQTSDSTVDPQKTYYRLVNGMYVIVDDPIDSELEEYFEQYNEQSAPPSIYYKKTTDVAVSEEKIYYESQLVGSVDIDDVGNYYEPSNNGQRFYGTKDEVLTTDKYALTFDVAVNSTKTYYKLIDGIFTAVEEPIVEEIGSYYEVVLDTLSYPTNYFINTSDQSVDPDKIYYLCTLVSDPVESEMMDYYEEIGESSKYVKTTDEIIEEQNYYRIEPALEKYYDFDQEDAAYVKTEDEHVDLTKTYYMVNLVTEPDVADIDTYYEMAGFGRYILTEDTELDEDNEKSYFTIESVVASVVFPNYFESVNTNVANGKNYYVMSAVDEPSVEGIGNYYEAVIHSIIDVETLTEMPLTVTAVGAGSNGTTTIYVERSEAYHVERPDESVFNGYENETILQDSRTGEAQFSFGVNDLIGSLDDGAKYRIVAVVEDSLGQTATATKDFTVRWNHQALMPTATVEMDEEELIAKITPIAPEGIGEGDTCDIYRLSVDKPELIIKDGTFGTTYVDPYPALGDYGGHRVVFKTVNGDFITEDNHFAWIDLNADNDDFLFTPYTIFDFDRGRVDVLYNIELSNSWKKDFKETKYLGGHIQGDWNPAVSRTSSVNTVSVLAEDSDTIQAMRRLATYAGICHVRTRDGSSYAADVQVSENMSYSSFELVSYSLSITRVDSEGYEGMTLAEWEELHQDDEEE